MTVSRASLTRLASHWAVEAVGVERVAAAHDAATSLHVEANLGGQLRRDARLDRDVQVLIRDVAFAYEIAASEYIDELAQASTPAPGSEGELAEAAAHEAFGLLRSLPLATDSLEGLVRQVLQLGALAYCSDRWAEFRSWMRERDVTPEKFRPSADWDSRVLSDLGQVWTRLLRKDGWDDLEGVAQIIARLRADQNENEALLFQGQERAESVHASGWRLVALYHWARLSELVATYLMQGEPADIVTQLDFHFDRAISAAQQSADPTFVVVLRWQRAMAQRIGWYIDTVRARLRAAETESEGSTS